MDVGINFFDIVNIYVKYEFEEIFGKVFGNCRKDVIVVLKVRFCMIDNVNGVGLICYYIMN